MNSVFIPFVFPNISKERIAGAFHANGLAEVESIDLVPKIDAKGRQCNYAFVHLKRWYDTDVSVSFREKLGGSSKQARVVYDDPWYWVILPNTARKEPCIDLVDTSYVSKLESEIAKLYLENRMLKEALVDSKMEEQEDEEEGEEGGEAMQTC
jgi:hypothetical protein